MNDEIALYGTAAGDVAAAVAGTSPGREGLEWIADIIRGRRARTQIKVLTKTAAALDEAGLSAAVVPNKVLVPLLEFAGLEDEDDDAMLNRWANLLATAATKPDRRHVAYPELLRQLEPVEAQCSTPCSTNSRLRSAARATTTVGLTASGHGGLPRSSA
jgi:hypothetical protein